MSIFAQNGKLDTNDLDLKQGYGFKAAADNATAMNDYMVEDFAAQHPDMAFIHAYPGIVRTPILDTHWPLKLLKPVAKLISIRPADCAQWMLYMLLDPQFSKGAFFRCVGLSLRSFTFWAPLLLTKSLGTTMQKMSGQINTALRS